MYGIYANMWGILMVNVTIYSIHGSYGYPVVRRELRSYGYSYSILNRELRNYQEFPNHILEWVTLLMSGLSLLAQLIER